MPIPIPPIPDFNSDSNSNLNILRSIFYECYRNGNYINAILAGEKLSQYYHSNGDKESRYYADDLFFLAYSYDSIEDFDKASYYYIQSINASVNSKEFCGELADRLNNLAICYNRLGKLKESETLFKEALNVRQIISGEKNTETARVLYNLGNAYYDLEDFNEALNCHIEALSSLSGYEEIDCLNSIGYCYEKLNEYDDAVICFEKALKGLSEIDSDESLDYLSNILYLAQICDINKDTDRMYKYYKKSLKLIKLNFSEIHPYYAGVLNHISEYYSYIGEIKKSVNYKMRALNILKKSLGKNHMYYANCLKSLAVALFAVPDYKKCVKMFKEALSVKESLIGLESDEYIYDIALFFRLMLDIDDYEIIIKLGKYVTETNRILYGEDICSLNFKSFYNKAVSLKNDGGDKEEAYEYLRIINDCSYLQFDK